MMPTGYSMEGDVTDQNPQDDPQDRVMTLRITRSTLTLLASVAFLACTIALVTLFPRNGSAPEPTPVATTDPNDPLASALTATPSVPTLINAAPTLTGSYLAPDGQAVITPSAGNVNPNTGGQSGYPAPTSDALDPAAQTPDVSETEIVTQNGYYPAPGNPSAANTTPLPTFAPDRGPAGEQETAIVLATRAASTAAAIAPPSNPRATAPTNGGTGVATVPPGGIPAATSAPAATIATFPTTSPIPTNPPIATNPPLQPTNPPSAPQPPAPTVVVATALPRPTAPPTATPINADILRGNVRWTIDRSPVVLRREVRLERGASLNIDPGVEVRIAPGAAMYIEGVMSANGQPGQPVRFVNSAGRWDGIYVVAGGAALIEGAELRGGGSGGTLIASDGGTLTMRRSRVSDNGGQIRATNSRVEFSGNEISGNDMPYGSAIEIVDPVGPVTVNDNRIGGNRLADGASPLDVRNSTQSGAAFGIRRNLLVGERGPSMLLFTNGPLSGEILCNRLVNGTNGLQLKSQVPATSLNALLVRDNLLDDHTPPIEPVYLRFGIGRGATSDLALNMANNFWGSELGPYDPDRNPDGRGDAVGSNIGFTPWLTEPPACLPAR